ncbi:Protein of unknown function [Cotesia congregata]|uniref:Uncharacterized protein n=1 Tax=Cotesia congregata TaxID=51543 RepID=A0A8J2H4Z7_COTCN|nr:Protein of unknown function [Cotesia congregata]
MKREMCMASDNFFNVDDCNNSSGDSDDDTDVDSWHSAYDSTDSEEESDSDSDNEEINDNLNSPLFNGSPVTLGESVLSLLMLNKFLSSRNNISFTWNTDGIDLYKSSKFSIWPFYLVINVLPFNVRSQLKNVLIGGFWFGPTKPKANLFMDAFRQSINTIYQGFFVKIPNYQNMIKVRGVIICGTCDLPAKACFLNMKGHTATYGCCKCKIQTKKEGGVRVFPYENQLNLRTSEETIQQGEQALETGEPIEGVKGPTTLSKIVHDFIVATSIDSMHCIFAGVCKQLMRLWFDSEFTKCSFSLRNHINYVDEKIRSINPPSFTHRLPRKISDYKYWKASEMKYWLLYYSLIILYPIMPTAYYQHHKLLVQGITYLSQHKISKSMIEAASQCLNQYVERFQDLYGLRHMTCNLHQLRHLPDAVNKFGPERVTSCFQFENLNGLLRCLANGTRYAQLQISKVLSIFFNIAELKMTQLRPESEITNFCTYLEKNTRQRRKLQYIRENVAIIGKITRAIQMPENLVDILEEFGLQNYHDYYFFHRLFKNRVVFDSKSYERKRKTISNVVKYYFNGELKTGIVETFIKACRCNLRDCEWGNCDSNSDYYAILVKCYVLDDEVLDLILICEKSHDQMIAVNIYRLERVCYFIERSEDPNTFYVVDPVNNVEFY